MYKYVCRYVRLYIKCTMQHNNKEIENIYVCSFQTLTHTRTNTEENVARKIVGRVNKLRK